MRKLVVVLVVATGWAIVARKQLVHALTKTTGTWVGTPR